MNIREAHDELNNYKEGEFQYQRMTVEEIHELLLTCYCPVAIGLGIKVVLVNGIFDSQRSQASAVFHCRYAIEAESNGITIEARCKILKGDLCTQHCPHGDLESGLGIYIHEEQNLE